MEPLPQQHRNGRLQVYECQLSQDHINKLTASLDRLCEKVDNIHGGQDKIIRYLLIVVCIIALGRTLIEAVTPLIAKAETYLTETEE